VGLAKTTSIHSRHRKRPDAQPVSQASGSSRSSLMICGLSRPAMFEVDEGSL